MPVTGTLIQEITKHCLLFLIISAGFFLFSPTHCHKPTVIGVKKKNLDILLSKDKSLKFIMSGFRKCINCFLLTADVLQSSDNVFFLHNTP